MTSRPAGHLSLEPHNHVVEFYHGDEDLGRSAGRYILEALKACEPVVVFATDEHIRLFEREVARGGIAVGRARSEGMWVAAGVAEIIPQFLVDGRVDRNRFDSVVGGLIRELSGRGSPVRAFGEMVSVLWAAGQVPAAMAVEQAWNQLGESLNFSIFCAYPKRSLAAPGAAPYLDGVFRAHSAVVGGCPVWRVPDRFEETKLFENMLAAPAEARRFVVGTLRHWGRPDLVDSAALVVSELATNVVLHARSRFSVTVAAVPPIVRISVQDGSPDLPTRRAPAATDRSGRGLALVAGISSNWGARWVAGGKVIWADLGAPPGPPQTSPPQASRPGPHGAS